MAVLTLKSRELESFPTIAVDFANHKKSIEGRSEQTVCEYLIDLRIFFRYLRAVERDIPFDSPEFNEIDISTVTVEDMERVTAETIYRFLFYADRERNNAAVSRSRKLSALRAFFRFLHTKKHLISRNPTADIEGPHHRAALPKYLTLEESLQLLAAAEGDTESKSRLRDYAILTLFLNCGMRLAELVGIDLNDIDRQMQSLRVTGKGNKQRIVYLNDACRDALRAYLAERLAPDPRTKGNRALFLSSRMQRISPKTVQWMVYRYLDMAGLSNRGLSVHKLRHTAATLMYQTGNVDIRVLKDVLGHEQLSTTQIYTHVSDKGMQSAMDANPLAVLGNKKKDGR